jgi:glycosyltransferase involved in cell wall biosynthesis
MWCVESRPIRLKIKTVNSFVWHLITGEYPPQIGGVSDHTFLIATNLAAAGDEVHVWCPSTEGETEEASKVEMAETVGVFVHRELGRFTPADLRRVGGLLDQFDAPRRLLVQWVPHSYGYRSMNLPFCVWLWKRAVRRGDVLEVMIHEPYLAFGEGSWKQSCVAVVHRLMTVVLLKATRRIWITIPAWEAFLRPYTLGRVLPFRWLPVASSIAVIDDPARVIAIRARCVPIDGLIVGHFGAYSRHTIELLLNSVPALLHEQTNCAVLLLGRGSDAARDELTRKLPEVADRIYATGTLAAADLSSHISACDLLIQPYIDGVSSRRTSLMVGLAHGRPVVTTVGRLTETLWAENEAVVLVPVEDTAELVDATRRLLADEARRHRMSAAARRLYDERFDVKRAVAELREAVA